MSSVTIRVAHLRFTARFEEAAAPRTCTAFRALMPFSQQLIQTRWSGEAAWVPMGDLDLGLAPENATSHPSRGDILLYPRGAKAKASVTLASGETITGELAYQDEFTIAVRDSSGRYRSWPVSAVKFTVDNPAEAHARLLGKYTDDDIHNLMAYLQTLR